MLKRGNRLMVRGNEEASTNGRYYPGLSPVTTNVTVGSLRDGVCTLRASFRRFVNCPSQRPFTAIVLL
jgi:hypothetical protein